MCGVYLDKELMDGTVNIGKKITEFLAKEYVEQHRQEILAKVDVTAVTNAIAIKVAEQVVLELAKKEKPNE
jgi:hypothetical protein